ncbi:uncharacterized protein PAF06_003904 [Gastrophryne carolinensis]
MPGFSMLYKITGDMGNSVSCVRKPKEPRPGKEPLYGNKKRRFKRKKKDKEEQDGMPAQKEEECVEAQDLCSNTCVPFEDPGSIQTVPEEEEEEGRLLQVRKTLHGVVQRAQLLTPLPTPGSPQTGTTVIAHIVDNPADCKQRSVSTMVEFDRAGNSRAVLLPISEGPLENTVGTATLCNILTDPRMSSRKSQSPNAISSTPSSGTYLSSSGYCSAPLSQSEKVGF